MARDGGIGPPRTGTGCSVVIVEDHPVLRRTFSRQLADAGLLVTAAVGTFREGLDAVHGLGPDVAVVANWLPDGRGIDLCRLISLDAPRVVVLLHAGVISAAEEQEALDAGVVAIVPKSIRSGSLVAAVLSHAPSGA